MSRLDVNFTVQCAHSPDQAKQIAVSALTQLKWRATHSEGQAAELEQGNQFLTRLVGGWFCNPAWFPAKAKVAVREGVGCTLVDLLFEEALGFGILDGLFKNRYQMRFDECIRAVESSLKSPVHNPFI